MTQTRHTQSKCYRDSNLKPLVCKSRSFGLDLLAPCLNFELFFFSFGEELFWVNVVCQFYHFDPYSFNFVNFCLYSFQLCQITHNLVKFSPHGPYKLCLVWSHQKYIGNPTSNQMQTQPNLKHILQSTKFNPNKIIGLFSANSPQTLQTSIPQSPQISINKIPNKSNELRVGLYPFKGYAGNFELISSPVTKSTKHTFTPLCFFVILIQRFFSCNE